MIFFAIDVNNVVQTESFAVRRHPLDSAFVQQLPFVRQQI